MLDNPAALRQFVALLTTRGHQHLCQTNLGSMPEGYLAASARLLYAHLEDTQQGEKLHENGQEAHLQPVVWTARMAPEPQPKPMSRTWSVAQMPAWAIKSSSLFI